MYSMAIEVRDNRSEDDRDRGILFNYANNVTVQDNIVTGGPEKCIFIYNSNKNIITRNYLSECAIGVHFTAGSERNVIFQNAFVSNRTQVKYVGTRWLDWSSKGQGNYWSDHAAFDLNRDGIADRAYKPNDLTDQILWRHPAAKLLVNSPAVQILKWAQSAFPALHPGGVIDSAPLMLVPHTIKKKLESGS
jgi:nitrous oxidase accessory protein